MSFREVVGKQILWKDAGLQTGFSNFLFIDQNYGSDPVMRRIFSQARKHGFQSFLIDEINESECPLLQQENEALRVRRNDYQRSVVHRISFFRTPSGYAPAATDFLGYVVYKQDLFASDPIFQAHVYESVTMPCRGALQNNFIHCQREFEITTSLGKFRISGILYAQQNDLTFVCAHVALRSVLASVMPKGDISYPEMNRLLGIDHIQQQVGGGAGLKPDQIELLFKSVGVDFEKVVNEPANGMTLTADFQRDLYGFIESGFPALVGFELNDPNPSRHIIPVFGHTFNEDTWLPNAQRAYFGGHLAYYPSENWLSTFTVHDDNFGPYFCVPRYFLKSESFRLMYGLKRHPACYGAVDAEAAGFAWFQIIARTFKHLGLDWYDRFVVFARGWLVLRTVLLSRDEYLCHLQHITGQDGSGMEPQHQQRLKNLLPDFFWMVEASAAELFTVNRRKFGEALLSAQKPLPNPLDESILLAARLPGLLLLGGGKPPVAEKTNLTGHTELFTF